MRTIAKSLFIVFTFLLISIGGTKAQGNLLYVDDKPIHFGFSLGTNFMDFALIPTSRTENVSNTTLIPGFSVGGIVDYRLSQYFNLRFAPTLNLGQRTLTYASDGTNLNILSIPLYMPIYMKYSALRFENFRPYVIGGAGIWMDWATNKEKPVLLKQFDTIVEAGVGCDIYFSFFKLCPEIKFGVGLNDILVPLNQRDAELMTDQNKKYTEQIKKLTTRMLTFTFNFE